RLRRAIQIGGKSCLAAWLRTSSGQLCPGRIRHDATDSAAGNASRRVSGMKKHDTAMLVIFVREFRDGLVRQGLATIRALSQEPHSWRATHRWIAAGDPLDCRGLLTAHLSLASTGGVVWFPCPLRTR